MGVKNSERADIPEREGPLAVQTFAQRLRELRRSAGMTQARLATLADVHKLTVTKLELGYREPSLEVARALADALGVGLEAFARCAPTHPSRGRGARG